ncbi:MAG TPA: hypothetical protein V6C96_03330, partial [Vampirovibrionales bacterium]
LGVGGLLLDGYLTKREQEQRRAMEKRNRYYPYHYEEADPGATYYPAMPYKPIPNYGMSDSSTKY